MSLQLSMRSEVQLKSSLSSFSMNPW